MNKFNEKIISTNISGIANIVEESRNIDGKVIHLEVGDIDFSVSRELKKHITKAIYQNNTHYPPLSGNNQLVNEIISKEWMIHKKRIEAENIYITSGGSFGVYLGMQTIINEGDEIVMFEPIWPHFFEMAKLCGAKVQRISLNSDNGFHINKEILESIIISSKTKAILINTPNNPTGVVWSKEEIQLISEFAHNNDLYLICDEEYNAFCFNDEFTTVPSLKNNIVVRSFSKTYAIAGLRLGYIIGSKEWIEQIKKWGLFSIMYSSSIVQQGVADFMAICDDFTNNMRIEIRTRADIFHEKVSKNGKYEFKKPEGSVYFWLDCRDFIIDDVNFAKKLLYDAKIAVVPGSFFGDAGKGFLRISLGADQNDLEIAGELIINQLENSNSIKDTHCLK